VRSRPADLEKRGKEKSSKARKKEMGVDPLATSLGRGENTVHFLNPKKQKKRGKTGLDLGGKNYAVPGRKKKKKKKKKTRTRYSSLEAMKRRQLPKKKGNQVQARREKEKNSFGEKRKSIFAIIVPSRRREKRLIFLLPLKIKGGVRESKKETILIIRR